MQKEVVLNKRKELEIRRMELKKELLNLLSTLQKSKPNDNFIVELNHFKKTIEKEQFSMIDLNVRMIHLGYIVLEDDEQTKKKNQLIFDKVEKLTNEIVEICRYLDFSQYIIDKGPMKVTNKTIVITDPCYFVKDRDVLSQPKWSDFHPYSNIKDYPDYDEKTRTSKMFSENDKKYNEAYKKWDSENQDDWEECEYGEKLEVLNIHNYLSADTIVGDWSCTTYDVHTENTLGRFCADAGKVCVCELDEVLEYNPDFLKWATEHKWCATIIENFTGEICIKIQENKERVENVYIDGIQIGTKTIDSYDVYVEGIGSIHFITKENDL